MTPDQLKKDAEAYVQNLRHKAAGVLTGHKLREMQDEGLRVIHKKDLREAARNIDTHAKPELVYLLEAILEE